MPIDIRQEINFKTSRSGGKGGQNVNKVESAVTGIWKPSESAILSEEAKVRVVRYLQNRLNKEKEWLVSSQVHRGQLANKEEVVKKMNAIVNRAAIVRKPRIATKIPRGVQEARLNKKKQRSEIKKNRGRVDY